MTVELLWYAELREEWRPKRVRLLLVGESAPDPGATEKRFFYAPRLDRRDNLFRGVVAALYGPIAQGSSGLPKAPWLERLREDGVFLVDLVPFPVDKLGGKQRRQKRVIHVPQLIGEAEALQPDGIIVCHKPTFEALHQPLKAAGLPLLHDQPLPFPLGNMRRRFIAGLHDALATMPGWSRKGGPGSPT